MNQSMAYDPLQSPMPTKNTVLCSLYSVAFFLNSFLHAHAQSTPQDLQTGIEAVLVSARNPHAATLAREHAFAIESAARLFLPEWKQWKTQYHWQHFDPAVDLSYLIAAIAYQETRFRAVIAHKNYGPMQVHAPTPLAKECGLTHRNDYQNMVKDLVFSYTVGACVLTQTMAIFLERYQKEPFARTRGTAQYKREPKTRAHLRTFPNSPLFDLLAIERYNWGSLPLYQHPQHGRYALHVIEHFLELQGASRGMRQRP
jgi:hypothetical protein